MKNISYLDNNELVNITAGDPGDAAELIGYISVIGTAMTLAPLLTNIWLYNKIFK
ncbi:hypothetical protein [Roseivirga pacifica]|uniref:hypothetical protein n=1 Tax=Roseivirga pacifica TaxID=1267423 RepID=UPI00227B242F|nr:hypothetical protein [Roseivirga pacifica]